VTPSIRADKAHVRSPRAAICPPRGAHMINLSKRFECRHARPRHKRQRPGFRSAETFNPETAAQACLQHRCKSDHHNQTQDRLRCTPHIAFHDSLWKASAAFLCMLSKPQRFHGFSLNVPAQSCAFLRFDCCPELNVDHLCARHLLRNVCEGSSACDHSPNSVRCTA